MLSFVNKIHAQATFNDAKKKKFKLSTNFQNCKSFDLVFVYNETFILQSLNSSVLNPGMFCSFNLY